MTCCNGISVVAQKCYPDPKGKTSSSISVSKHKSKSSSLTPAPTSPRDVKALVKSAPPKHRVPQKDIPTHSSAGTAPTVASSGKSIREKTPIAKPIIKREPDTFTDLFGPPLQSRPSPDPTKQRVSVYSVCNPHPFLIPFFVHQEQNRKPKVEKEIRIKSEKQEPVPSSKSSAESSVPSKKSSSRPSSPNLSKSEDKSSKRSKGKKKKKRERSSSRSSDDSDSPDRSESCHRTDSKSKSEKERKTKVRGKDIRTVTPVSTSASSSQQKSKKKNFTSTTISFSNSDNTGRTMSVEIKSVTKEKTYDSESKKSKNKEFNNSEAVDAEVGQSQERKREISSSPVSSGSDPQTAANGAAANGSCDDLFSPRSPSSRASSDPASRRRKKRGSGSDGDIDLTARDKKWKQSGAGDSSGEDDQSDRHEDYLSDLYWIQKRINESTDANLLQRIVDIVEVKCSEFQVTSTCFEFDLTSLDDETISKLKQMVGKG